MQIAGHAIHFVDCREIGQAGPIACSLVIDDQDIEHRRFDPSPIEFERGILVPVQRWNFIQNGYALCYIDLETRRLKVVSRIFPYMRLVRVTGRVAEFNRTTYTDETRRVTIGSLEPWWWRFVGSHK